jgi:glutamine synthetase
MNKDNIEIQNKIKTIIEEFAKNQLLTLIGFEFEFYICKKNKLGNILYTDNLFNNNIEKKFEFIEKINILFKENNFDANFKPEEDNSQFEISTNPSPDPLIYFHKMNEILKIINNFIKFFFKQNEFEIIYNAKPFKDRPGNGMHFHISLHNIPSLENIFGLITEENHKFLKNKFLRDSISVIMFNLKKNIDMFFKNQSMIDRIIYPDRNTPINFSWGKNNRTTAIRIPESLPSAKTIEFRVPSSENNFYESLYFILNSVFIGIFEFENFLLENSLQQKSCLPEPIFGLSFDEQYKLEKFIEKLNYKNL